MPFLFRKNRDALGIYIHVPFCRSKCQYCDFYSLTTRDSKLMDAYRDAICTHIRETAPQAREYLVDTIYFGGGTPTYFGAEGLVTILDTLRKCFRVSDSAEITFEANPDSVSDKLLRKLYLHGFNRVSLGIQCDDDEILKKLGRPHTYAQAVTAVEKIRKAGFKNLSVDLMYGLPGQGLEDWNATLRNVISLKPEHISCYGLKIEEGTPFYDVAEFLKLADDDLQADMYLSGVKILAQAGYRQYEISNFCQKGHVSRHNLKYWNLDPYLGFGPNASSDFGGQRFTAVRDVRGYIEGIRTGGQVVYDVQKIPQRERAGEYLMMRLRTTGGIDPAEYERRYLLPFAPLEKALLRQRGLAAKTYDGRWHLTPEGFLVSNSILSDLLLIQEKTLPLGKR